ncbi:tektin-1-like [Oscarella lobularis]|uniref:tektin-1-like n=1 Tax=Oscarella lobularis TaxID=121494 RepID=UPI00331325C4
MASLVRSPQKYSVEEWHQFNRQKYHNADTERATAERLRAESERLRAERQVKTNRTQSDVNKKLDQRAKDIEFWKSELHRQHDAIACEIEAMLEKKVSLERALAETEFPLQVSKTCLDFREKRVSVDVVHDDVEINLKKEMEMITGIRALLQKTLEESVEQIRLLRSKKFYLEKDMKDKFSALEIDAFCSSLHNESPHIHFSETKATIDAKSVTPDDWESFSNENILKAESERMASATLRGIIEDVLTSTSNDIQLQRNSVNAAFASRIAELKKTKETLENHLEKVNTEISSMELNIDSLQADISAKMGPLKVAQTRLDQRNRRQNVELVRDPAQYRLVGEVKEIEESLALLHEKLAESIRALKGLNRQQLALEEDIQVKSNSLNIDENQCMKLREQLH